jgi:dTDP-4-amino-4,6-dideoxygalactose transaminase
VRFRPQGPVGVGAVKISAAEKRYVQEVLDSNRLSYGPFSRRLEREFAAAHDCAFCVLTNSGTSSLQIAVAALKERDGWRDGDEVLCPSTTFVATPNVILQNNLRPVFVDVEPRGYNLDPARIEERITPRTRGLMVVHLYGQPAEMDPILEIARRRRLAVIEDSAETMFARYRGRSVGSFGEIACFSTYAAHILVTGVGGLTATNDQELAVLLRSLANHGRDSIYLSIDDDRGLSGAALREVMERRFRFVRLGYSYRITELEAALGVGQMEHAAENLAVRRRAAARMLAGLSRFEDVLQLPRPLPERDHAYMMFPLVIREGAPFSREDLTFFLEEHLVETRQMVSVLDQPFYRRLYGEDVEDRYPVARWIDRSGFYVGCHPEMTDPVVDYVLECFEEFFAGVLRRGR